MRWLSRLGLLSMRVLGETLALTEALCLQVMVLNRSVLFLMSLERLMLMLSSMFFLFLLACVSLSTLLTSLCTCLVLLWASSI